MKIIDWIKREWTREAGELRCDHDFVDAYEVKNAGKVFVDPCSHKWVNVHVHRDREIHKVTSHTIIHGGGWIDEPDDHINKCRWKHIGSRGDVFIDSIYHDRSYEDSRGMLSSRGEENDKYYEFLTCGAHPSTTIVTVHYPVDKVCVKCGECHNGWTIALSEASGLLEEEILKEDRYNSEQRRREQAQKQEEINMLNDKELAKKIWEQRCCK